MPEATKSSAAFRRFAWAALGLTLAVILWGAYVRASGSGAGCGSHWPKCNGEVVPHARTMATIIEFTHRLTSGLVTIVALIEVIWAFLAFPKAHPVRRGAAATMILMLTEGLVGAALVLFEHVAQDKSVARAGWMSLHLVNTFFLIAAMTCTAWWASGGGRVRLRGQGVVGWILGAGIVGLLATGISGAITALGDTLFTAPSLRQGLADDLSPAAHFLQQLRVIHPAAAVMVGLYLLWARSAVAARRPSPAVRRLSLAVGLLVGAQLALGFLNLALLAPVAMQLVHLLAADLVWVTFVLLAAAALAEPVGQQIGVTETPAERYA